MLTIRELEIMKAALECDIAYQKRHLEYMHGARHDEFNEWLNDTERLLTKVAIHLSAEKFKEQRDDKDGIIVKLIEKFS